MTFVFISYTSVTTTITNLRLPGKSGDPDQTSWHGLVWGPPFKVQEGLLQLLLRTKLFALVTQSPARLTSPAMSHFSGYEPVLKQ